MSATADLKAEFTVNQSSADLFCEFRVVVHFSGEPRNLFAKFFRGADASQDLYAVFETQATRNLPAEFVVRHTATKDLFSEFRVALHFGEGWEDLKGVMLITRPGSADLPAEFIIRQSGDVDLSAEAIIRHSAAVDQFAEMIIRHSASVDLATEFVVRHSASADLKAVTVIRHTGVPQNLFATMEIEPVADLFAEFIVRHEASAVLQAAFYIRHPIYLWTTRRYVNGVVDAAETLIGDAKFEYVVEGVMEDIEGILAANQEESDWADITEVPVLIRRATTYGSVAALYARHSRTFRSRIIPTAAPVTVTTIGDDERAMQYWEGKMKQAIDNYLAAEQSDRLWVSTSDEEPVFTMRDIPISQYGPGPYESWHDWYNQRGSS